MYYTKSKIWIVLLVAFFSWSNAYAQEAEESEKELASPSVLGMGKSKGLRIGYEIIADFDINSEKQGHFKEEYDGEIRRNNKFNLKVYAPVFNNPHFKMVVGFHHEFEEFNFNREPALTEPFYKNLEDKNLKTIGGQVVMLRPLNSENFVVLRLKGELNGDYHTSELNVSDYLKGNVEAVYGWKKSPTLVYGIAIQAGYNYGRRTILPAFLYNQTFNDKWGIESIIPANVMVRHNASEKSLFFAGYDLDGASYTINIEDPRFSQYENIELRKTEIRPVVRWEREIYDFLWFGVETGYRFNVRFHAFSSEARDANPIIKSTLKPAPFAMFELFLVPPRRFLKQK